MAHWKDRIDWMNEESMSTPTHVAQTELWHGERFKELSLVLEPRPGLHASRVVSFLPSR